MPAGAFLRLIALGFVTVSANADIMSSIDFLTGSAPGGIISYAGADSPLIGNAIGIGNLTATNVPLRNGETLAVSNGGLFFSTGNFIAYDSGTDTYTFGPGGSIAIIGAVPGIMPDSTLLSGSFESDTTVIFSGSNGELTLSGSNSESAFLLFYFGLSPSLTFTFTGTLTTNSLTGGSGGAFSADPNTDIHTVVATPEPASVVLLGIALIGLALILQMRQHRFHA